MKFDLLWSSGGIALYGVLESAKPWTYFLCTEAGENPQKTLSMEGSWSFSGPGAYVISEDALPLEKPLLERLVSYLGLKPERRILSWVTSYDPSFEGASVVMSMPAMKVVGADQSVSFGNVGLLLRSGTAVQLTEAGLRFSSSQIQFQRGRQGYDLPPEGGNVTVSLAPPATGRLCFLATWQAFELFTLCRDQFRSEKPVRGGELRYFYDAEASETLSYPLFEAIEPEDERKLKLDLELDPLAPYDGERTRMLFRAAPFLKSAYGSTTSGDVVTLTPVVEGEQRAGFYFGRRPGEKMGEAAVYLAPLGSFALGLKGGEEGELPLMGGTSGLEYLAAATGDRLVFVPSQAAFAPSFGSKVADKSGEPLLRSTRTTSWVEFVPKEEGAGGRAYFGQPDASPSYGANVVPEREGKAMTLPAAVASRVRDLSAGSPAAFPMAFYGGALIPADLKVPSAEELMAFENSVLAPERGTRLRLSAPPAARETGDTPAPPAEAVPAAPVFSNADGEPLEGGTTSTPQGFVVELNPVETKPTGPAGTWNEVLFARAEGSKSEEQWLTLAAGKDGEVDPWLATSLVKDQLFLVLNDWSKLQELGGVLNVGGFDFEMTPTKKEEESEARKTVMVFKYATSQSLREMIQAPATWYLKEHFVGDETEVAKARETLTAALEAADQAEGETDDPFQYFREVVASDPTWTGLLTFNGKVPGTGMPPDLQILYAGLDGPLRAHHFGVELNQVERTGSSAKIKESSLFGVIHYLGGELSLSEPQPDYEYTLRELNVLIRNSAVLDFHAKVWLLANRLFGREVKLERAKPPPEKLPSNTILFAGQYQRHGSVGTVTFTAPGAEGSGGDVFAFIATGGIRVLEKMRVSGASLVPVSSTAIEKKGEEKKTELKTQVTLSGALSFAESPFPGVELDLFSYKDPGIGISGLALTMECTLYASGAKSETIIYPDLSKVLLADDLKARRGEALLAKLPLSLRGFLSEKGKAEGKKEEKLDISKLGALPVNVPALAEPGGRITSQPTYALEFDLPMGTLGGLADAHASIDAKLILGWGPSTVTPDDDAVGVFVQPPFLSGGAFGLELQGLLKTTFGDANLARVKPAGKDPTYVLLFNNIAISVLGIRFPPRVIVDFILFAGSGGSSNLGWSLAALEPKAAQLPAAVEQV